MWEVKLPPQPERKGPTEISVQFVNTVGLPAFATTTVVLVENDPVKTAPGVIRGRVMYGAYPSPNLGVTLYDDKNADKGKVMTNEKGMFEFKDLPAGRYRVVTARRTDGRLGAFPRKPLEFITLPPGGTQEVTVELFLEPGP